MFQNAKITSFLDSWRQTGFPPEILESNSKKSSTKPAKITKKSIKKIDKKIKNSKNKIAECFGEFREKLTPLFFTSKKKLIN